MLPTRRPSFLRPLLSAVLFAYAYIGHFWFADVLFLIPLLSWLDDERDPLRQRWGVFLFAAVTYGITLHFHYAMASISWLAFPLWIGFALAESVKFALLFTVILWIRRKTGWGWLSVLPACWITAEWFTEHLGDLRMTGDHLSHIMSGAPYALQIAEWTGPYGISAVIIFVNVLVYECLYARHVHARQRALRLLIGAVLLLAMTNGALWFKASQNVEEAPKFKVAAIQPNVPLEIKHDEKTAREQSNKLKRLTSDAADQGVDWVVWPESARPYVFYESDQTPGLRRMVEVESLAADLGITLLVGTEYVYLKDGEIDQYMNGAFLIWPDGTLREEWGGKVFLVPFTEGVPFKNSIGRWMENLGGEFAWMAGGFDPARETALLKGPEQVRMGVLVCYEEFFASLSSAVKNRGANVQAVITNDAWFGRTFLQRYLNNAVRLRAIESRTSFVRAANTGYSSLIDPLGNILDSTELFEEDVLIGELPVLERRTFYNRMGDWPAYGALAGFLFIVGFALTRKKASS